MQIGAETVVARPDELSPEQVRLVQQALARQGYDVAASGTFDAATERSLVAFQERRQLPQTGDLNAPTADALGIAPERLAPARPVGGAGP